MEGGSKSRNSFATIGGSEGMIECKDSDSFSFYSEALFETVSCHGHVKATDVGMALPLNS